MLSIFLQIVRQKVFDAIDTVLNPNRKHWKNVLRFGEIYIFDVFSTKQFPSNTRWFSFNQEKMKTIWVQVGHFVPFCDWQIIVRLFQFELNPPIQTNDLRKVFWSSLELVRKSRSQIV